MQIDVLTTSPAALGRLASRLPLRMLGGPGDVAAAAILWIHGDVLLDRAAREGLAERLAGGGKALFTGTAAALLYRCGIESVPPETRRGVWARSVGPRELRGVMGLPGQPLFHRTPGGPYLSRAIPDGPRNEVVWAGDRWPRRARVLGVEKLPIGCDVTRAILLEASHGRGRVLALGAHFPLDTSDPEFDEIRARFVGDLFDYLASDLAGERSREWPDPAATRGVRILGGALAETGPVPSRVEPPAATPDRPELTRLVQRDDVPADSDPFFAVVTANGAIYGSSRAGPTEIWMHSFRAFREFELRIARDGEVPVALRDLQATSRIHRDEVRWQGQGSSPEFELRVARATARGGFVIALSGSARLRLVIEGASDLRAFWPYPAGLAAELRVTTTEGGALTTFRDALFGSEVRLVAGQIPVRSHTCDASRAGAGGDGGAIARFTREFVIEPGVELCIGVESAAVDPIGESEPSLRIATGDATLDAAFDLCRARMRDFFVRFDATHSGLVAGHDRSRPGWFTGRPGYAWFFARDAFFCDHVLLPFGALEIVRSDLLLAARFQDPLGKIHHEITPLGVVHHDAADSTPMFVDVLARYLAWTGDVEFVRSLWPAVRRALDFLEATDRDGDGLPENVGVGHGWMEGGVLAERVATEVYLAAFACRAWLSACSLAAVVGDALAVERARAAALRARDSLRTRFHREADGGYAHAIRTDGSRDDRDAVTTVMPWALAVGEHGRENDALPRFATARAQADWGSRMLPSDDPDYDPASYQAGSVWPLFTGWSNLADFQYGRPDSAWLRLVPMAKSVEQFAPGCVQEVFRGDVYRPRGIAAMQAWSHAAVLSGFVEGLLGARVVPGEARIVIEPTLPGALDELTFAGLAIRSARLSGTIRRGAEGRDLQIEITNDGEAIELELAPFVPGPAAVGVVTCDGRAVDVHLEELGDGVLIRVRVPLPTGTSRLAFTVAPDLLLAISPRSVAPGATSEGPRFLGRRLVAADTLELRFELAGTATFGMRTPGRVIREVVGATVVDDGRALRIEPCAGEGYRACVVRIGFAPES